ncbi:putative cadmium/zinc-transporting ATPase HMA4 [Platanthera guangdongensis]|uniref:Cadmium/zinc-transporting ATPase HMA4 n=1 Tax=Platanthera guangdongensis TaxID=2320717 RepID=A0ABR2MTA5_9ASPA
MKNHTASAEAAACVGIINPSSLSHPAHFSPPNLQKPEPEENTTRYFRVLSRFRRHPAISPAEKTIADSEHYPEPSSSGVFAFRQKVDLLRCSCCSTHSSSIFFAARIATGFSKPIVQMESPNDRRDNFATTRMSLLMSMVTQKAILAQTCEIIEAKDVEVNTLLAMKAGEVIPIDGIVVPQERSETECVSCRGFDLGVCVGGLARSPLAGVVLPVPTRRSPPVSPAHLARGAPAGG